MPELTTTETQRIRRDAARSAKSRNHDDEARRAFRRLTGSKLPPRVEKARAGNRLLFLEILAEVVGGQIVGLRNEISKGEAAVSLGTVQTTIAELRALTNNGSGAGQGRQPEPNAKQTRAEIP